MFKKVECSNKARQLKQETAKPMRTEAKELKCCKVVQVMAKHRHELKVKCTQREFIPKQCALNLKRRKLVCE